MVEEQVSSESALRERAIEQLKKRREFQTHLLVYVLVNAMLVAIWALSTPGGFFWPLFSIVGWGIGVVLHGWDVYFASEPDEAKIQRMMETLQRRA